MYIHYCHSRNDMPRFSASTLLGKRTKAPSARTTISSSVPKSPAELKKLYNKLEKMPNVCAIDRVYDTIAVTDKTGKPTTLHVPTPNENNLIALVPQFGTSDPSGWGYLHFGDQQVSDISQGVRKAPDIMEEGYLKGLLFDPETGRVEDMLNLPRSTLGQEVYPFEMTFEQHKPFRTLTEQAARSRFRFAVDTDEVVTVDDNPLLDFLLAVIQEAKRLTGIGSIDYVDQQIRDYIRDWANVIGETVLDTVPDCISEWGNAENCFIWRSAFVHPQISWSWSRYKELRDHCEDEEAKAANSELKTSPLLSGTTAMITLNLNMNEEASLESYKADPRTCGDTDEQCKQLFTELFHRILRLRGFATDRNGTKMDSDMMWMTSLDTGIPTRPDGAGDLYDGSNVVMTETMEKDAYWELAPGNSTYHLHTAVRQLYFTAGGVWGRLMYKFLQSKVRTLLGNCGDREFRKTDSIHLHVAAKPSSANTPAEMKARFPGLEAYAAKDNWVVDCQAF